MKKKILKMVVAMTMLAVLSIPAFAAEIQPRRDPCGNCTDGFIAQGYTVLNTQYSKYRPCECNPPKYDQEDRAYRELRQDYARCTSCGWSWVGTEYWTDYMLMHWG